MATAEKLFERSPVGSMIVKHSRCLDPKHFDSNNAVESLKLQLKGFIFLEVIPPTTGAKIYCNFCLSFKPV